MPNSWDSDMASCSGRGTCSGMCSGTGRYKRTDTSRPGRNKSGTSPDNRSTTRIRDAHAAGSYSTDDSTAGSRNGRQGDTADIEAGSQNGNRADMLDGRSVSA